MINNININSPMTVKEIGLQALKEALGAVGATKFIQQFEDGQGDYTKEKYTYPDYTLEELDLMLCEEKSKYE